MPPTGTHFNRPQVHREEIEKGVSDLFLKLQYRLSTKGSGSYASRHEILGIITEEYLELVEAVREDGEEGYEHYKRELLDIAVAGIFGYICINSGHIHP